MILKTGLMINMKYWFLLSIAITLLGCEDKERTTGKTTMSNYEIYSEDADLSSLFIKTGSYSDGYDKLLHISIDHASDGVVIYRTALEKKLDEQTLTLDDIAMEKSDIMDHVFIYEKARDLGFRAYLKQSLSDEINFDNLVGACSDIPNSSGGIDCHITQKIQNFRVGLTYDKSQVHRFEEFKQMAEEAVVDYLPKHKEKYGERENPFKDFRVIEE